MPNLETMDLDEFEKLHSVQGRGGMPSRYRAFLAELEDGAPTMFPLGKNPKGEDEASDPTLVRNRKSQLLNHVKELREETGHARWTHFRYIIRQSVDFPGEEEIWALIPFKGDVTSYTRPWDHIEQREIAERVADEAEAAAEAAKVPSAGEFSDND